jgi:hypothetical protein
MADFWDVALCSPVDTASIIRAMTTLTLEAVSSSETSVNLYQTTRCNIPEGSHLKLSELLSMTTLTMEAVISSETSINIYQTTRCNVPQDSHLKLSELLLMTTLMVEAVSTSKTSGIIHQTTRHNISESTLTICTLSRHHAISSKVKLSRYTPWRHMGGEEV